MMRASEDGTEREGLLMRRTRSLLVLIGACLAVAASTGATAHAQGLVKVKMGQSVPTLGFLPVVAARALDTFAAEGVDLQWTLISGGDPPTLAALDAGEIDLAAVGSEAPLIAASKGAPYQIVYSLMSRMSVDLTVSNAFLKRAEVSPGDPLEKRLVALRGATIGVAAVRGAQERIARWLIGRAGLDPAKDINIALIGAPPALRAALEKGLIDGYVLTAPEGQLAEQGGFGKVFIRLGSEIPELRAFHHTVLVVKKPWAQSNPDAVTRVLRALIKASDRTLGDTKTVAQAIHQKFYAKAPAEAIHAAVEGLKDGVSGQGRMTPKSIAFLLEFTAGTGHKFDRPLDAARGEGDFWTNRFIDLAVRK
jgi:ABC-type nitrate/sulfonate/bicarbonate transport system substrate-binding protein